MYPHLTIGANTNEDTKNLLAVDNQEKLIANRYLPKPLKTPKCNLRHELNRSSLALNKKTSAKLVFLCLLFMQ